MEKKKDWIRPAWIAAVVFLFLIILEVLLIEVDAGFRVPLLSPLIDIIRQSIDTFLEIFRV